VDRASLQEGEAGSLKATQALAELLRAYAPGGGDNNGGEGGSEGGGGLSVPSEHLALLVEQTEWLSGSRAPRQPLARRAYLDEAWRRTLALPGS